MPYVIEIRNEQYLSPWGTIVDNIDSAEEFYDYSDAEEATTAYNVGYGESVAQVRAFPID
jgi:hypothetical protein